MYICMYIGSAQKLLNTTKLAREHIQVGVIILDPPALEEAYRVEREF